MAKKKKQNVKVKEDIFAIPKNTITWGQLKSIIEQNSDVTDETSIFFFELYFPTAKSVVVEVDPVSGLHVEEDPVS